MRVRVLARICATVKREISGERGVSVLIGWVHLKKKKKLCHLGWI